MRGEGFLIEIRFLPEFLHLGFLGTYRMDAQNAPLTGPDEKEYRLSRIYFYLTSECNLRCRHCWIAPRHVSGDTSQNALSIDLFRSILEQAKPLGLTGVKLTGGEPLLHSGISEILDITRQSHLRMTMETNGVLLTPDLAREIATCEGAFVSVSLDGADARTHDWVRGVQGSFDAALDGIRHLVAVGLKPQIIMTLMRHNSRQIGSMVELAHALGAESIKFNLLQPTARGEGLHKSGEALEVKEHIRLGSWVETELAQKTSVRLIYDYPAAFRPLGRMFGNNGNGCGVCGVTSIIGVLGDGSYALCGIGETLPDLVFGHAATDRLDEIWNHHPTIRQIRKGLPDRIEGVCRNCLMKRVCLGKCIAQNYYRSQNFWAPHWFCDEAQKRGLFPDSRLRPDCILTCCNG